MTDEQKKELLRIARETLKAHFSQRPAPVPITDPALCQPQGVFVTLHRRKDLRGCIGYLEPILPLWQAVREAALASALRDPRFEPVKEEELDALNLEISALSPFRKINRVEEIEVGRHGLYIRCGGFSGILLPQVATENQWNRETFLEQTCQKACLTSDAWRDPLTEIFVFEAEVFSDAVE